MHSKKIAASPAVATLPPRSVSTTPRVRIMFGDRVLATFGTVGRAIGASTKDIPTGAKVVDPEGRVRARLDHIVSTKGTWLAGWIMMGPQ